MDAKFRSHVYGRVPAGVAWDGWQRLASWAAVFFPWDLAPTTLSYYRQIQDNVALFILMRCSFPRYQISSVLQCCRQHGPIFLTSTID